MAVGLKGLSERTGERMLSNKRGSPLVRSVLS